MYSMSVENMYGEVLPLTGNPSYSVISVEGLNPPAAEINRSVLVTSDGSKYNSSRVGERNLVITVAVNPDVEQNRINLYKFFKVKQYTKISFKNSVRDVFIEGYVETFEINLFENGQKAQISILCPFPFFKSANNSVTEFFGSSAMFEFEFSVEDEGMEFSTINMDVRKSVVNVGDVESGFVIELEADSQVINPTIYDTMTGEFFRLNYTLENGDVVTINSNQGEKSVKLLRNAQTINMLNFIDKRSTWLKLRGGDNVFTYDSQTGYEHLRVTINHTDKYEGV